MIRDRYDYEILNVWIVCGQCYNDMVVADLDVEHSCAYKKSFDEFTAAWKQMRIAFDEMLAAAAEMVTVAGGYEALNERSHDLLDRLNAMALPVSMYADLGPWMFPIAPRVEAAREEIRAVRAKRTADVGTFTNNYREVTAGLKRETAGYKRDKHSGRN